MQALLDSPCSHANITLMTRVPHNVSSLARAFEPERQQLKKALGDQDLSASQIVADARRALDRAGASFAQDSSDPHIHKAGLWLIEMVKAGAGVLDQGTHADIIWHEVPKPKAPKIAGQGLFFSVAGGLAVVALMQQASLALMSVAALAALRLVDPANWASLRKRIPFMPKPLAIEDHSGRLMKAEAQVRADATGFVDSLADALRTADHILLRLSEPEAETHWRQDTRLMALVQSLLEASEAEDGDFALKLIGQELESILAAEGISRVAYSRKTKDLFDVLPGIGHDSPKLAAPALVADGEIIRRGTVWGPENG